MPIRPLLLAPLLAVMLPGCLARTAIDVVTLPVRAVGKGVDLATTSQSEADEKRGRDLRRREAELGKLEREYDKLQGQCIEGDVRACERQASVRARIDAILPTVPVEPR